MNILNVVQHTSADYLGLMEDPDAFTIPILDFLSRSQP